MKVFKFGGASVNTAERIKNVAAILKKYEHEKLLVVISAMGKTTNALEKVVEAFYAGEKVKSLQLFEEVKKQHLEITNQLVGQSTNQLTDFFTEVEWLLHDKPVRDYDYYYDQVVCVGELLSTAIISAFLNKQGVGNQWIDVRDIMRTDNTFRNAQIDWKITGNKTQELLMPHFEAH